VRHVLLTCRTFLSLWALVREAKTAEKLVEQLATHMGPRVISLAQLWPDNFTMNDRQAAAHARGHEAAFDLDGNYMTATGPRITRQAAAAARLTAAAQELADAEHEPEAVQPVDDQDAGAQSDAEVRQPLVLPVQVPKRTYARRLAMCVLCCCNC
jgi:hypothetical protein